jgi:hypothetical protein
MDLRPNLFMPCADLFSKIESLRKLVKKLIRIVQFRAPILIPGLTTMKSGGLNKGTVVIVADFLASRE